ncbi:MAG: hypothetical protein JW726_18725 [Anaerolineales bacterium]|nr:hypothetical protein [Anaerolineales bacterium]
MANEVVIDMLIGLQNEGIATCIEYKQTKEFPPPYEYFLYRLDKRPIVRWYIREFNELFSVAKAKPAGVAHDEVYRQIASLAYQKKGFYVVGAAMALTIEEELGRQALIQTVEGGYQAFADAYNSVADEEMRIQWSPEP